MSNYWWVVAVVVLLWLIGRVAANLSFSRSFHMTERYHLEIRLDAYNATNTAIFTNVGSFPRTRESSSESTRPAASDEG